MDDISRLQNDYEQILRSLSSKLSSLVSANSLARQREVLSELESEFYSLKNVQTSIDSSVRHLPYHMKSRHQANNDELRGRGDTLRKRYQRYERIIQSGQMVDANSAAPEDTQGPNTPSDDTGRDQRQRLLGAHAVVDSSGQSLDRTLTVLAETEQVGAATHEQLISQREQIISSRETLRDTDDFLSRSKRTLLRMKRRIATNKLISIVIILLELGIIALVVYLKYYN